MSAPARPPYRGTRLHALRIPDPVWAAARARAGEDGTSVTAVVVAMLQAYSNGERYVLPARRD
jgi:hypothetical protein